MTDKQPVTHSLGPDGVSEVPLVPDGHGGLSNSEVIVNPEVIYFDGLTFKSGQSLTITHSQVLPS